MLYRRASLGAFVLAALSAFPRAAAACSVCFGASDSPMAVGTNWGIFAMLAVVGGVLLGFGTFFLYLIRRANASPDPAPMAVGEGQEVAAKC
jgi:hypothetical protein